MSLLDVFGKGIENKDNAEGFYRRMMLKLDHCDVNLPPDAKFLEVGSGSGTVLSFLKEQGLDIEGVDIKPTGPDVIEANVTALQYDDESFDCVISKQVFDNIMYPMQSPETQNTMLREIVRVLKRGGIFYAVSEVLDEPIEGLRRLRDKNGDYVIAVYRKV